MENVEKARINKWSEMSLSMEKVMVAAETRRLSATYCHEFEADCDHEIYIGDQDLIEGIQQMVLACSTPDVEAITKRIIEENPDKVTQAKEKPSVAGWFVGQVMKATGGKANPNAVQKLVDDILNEEKEEMVTITKREYDDLMRDSLWLLALENAGVDNWQGIEYAQELFEGDDD